MKAVSVLGSTGSIGRSTLEVLRQNRDRFTVLTLSAGANVDLLAEQIVEFKPEFVSVKTDVAARELRGLLPSALKTLEIGVGVEGASKAASYVAVDVTVSAIVGAAGLVPTLAAIRAGKRVALANKETLVMAGRLVMDEARSSGARIIPVDSEHSAVMQSLEGHRSDDVRRIILTASGGPFPDLTRALLEEVTPEQALDHPRWDMGPRITVDSATLMNKAFEVIEARWLFDMEPERISVVIHPQSVVHSMVEYVDGSIVAQMSRPDMKGPIAYALSYPERIDNVCEAFDFLGARLDFSEPDSERFPCLTLAGEVLSTGGAAGAVVNAADEIAVEMFLKRTIPFTAIYRTIKTVLDAYGGGPADTIEQVLEADAWARMKAREVIQNAY